MPTHAHRAPRVLLALLACLLVLAATPTQVSAAPGASASAAHVVHVAVAPGPLSAPIPVGDLTAGSEVSLVFRESNLPLHLSAVFPEVRLRAYLSDPAELTADLGNATQVTALADAPAALTTLLQDDAARATLLSNAGALEAIVASPFGAPALLADATARAAVVDRIQADAHLRDAALGNAAFVTEALADPVSEKVVLDLVAEQPDALAAISQNTAAAQAFLADADALHLIQDTPKLREQLVTGLMATQHVSQVDLVAGQAGTNVQVVVKELVPTDPLQHALPAVPNLPAPDVRIDAVDVAGAHASFTPMKLLELGTTLPVGGLDHATVRFTVSGAELAAMGALPADVSLLHKVGDAWVALPTHVVAEAGADGLYTFEAETPSFSYFAIAMAEPVHAAAGPGVGAVVGILGALALVGVIAFVATRRRG